MRSPRNINFDGHEKTTVIVLIWSSEEGRSANI